MRGKRAVGKKSFGILLLLTPLLLVTLLPAGCSPSKPKMVGGAVVEPGKPPVNPLTGEEVSSWDLLIRRPLAVKVENDPQARPQSGIINADLVYEELVEGGMTRFICVYLARDSLSIGPTRSARPSDIDITCFLDPLLICSGGASHVISMLRASGMMFITEDSRHFWRDRSRRAPHNLYTSTDLLRAYLEESGDDYCRLPDSGLVFDSQTQTGEGGSGGDSAASATEINIRYKAATCAASYQYDAASDSYLHSINGAPHTDLTTGKRVAPRNVIVQVVTVTWSGARDAAGAQTPNLGVVGSGKCLVFSGGKVYTGTWEKADRGSPTRFKDPLGNPIRLRPGQTWIHLVTEDIGVDYR